MKKITLILFLFTISNLFAQNQLLSSVGEFFDTSASTWTISNGNDYSYDANGNLLESINYQYDASSNTFTPSSTVVYLYNNANLVTIELERSYNTTTQQYEDESRQTFTYNSSNQLTGSIGEQFTNGAWVNSYREIYSIANNRYTSVVFQDWNGVQWINEELATLTYNSNNQVTMGLYEEWVNNQWEIVGRQLFTFDSNGNVITNTFEAGDGVGPWTVDETSNYMYDSNNNRISDTSTSPGNGGFKEEFIHDTSIHMSTLDHPFKDKTGTQYLITGNPNVNKLTRTNQFDYDNTTMTFNPTPIFRTTHNYNSTLSTEEEIAITGIEFKLFPNPTSNRVTIEAANTTIKQIQLFDMLGKNVFTTSNTTFEIGQLINGLYVVKIEDENGTITHHKLIKK